MDYQTPIKRLTDKESKILFLTPDTKGVPIGAVIYIYEMVNTLKEQGYNAYILTENDQYTSVESWMGKEYVDLPHISFQTDGFMLNIDDFLIIPEFYSGFAYQFAEHKVPCKMIMLAQAHEYIFQNMEVSQHWRDLTDTVITTSERMKRYIDEVMFKMPNIEVINPFIPEFFGKNPKPQTPTVILFSRNIKDSENLYKQFYNMYPQYRWVNFKTLSKLDRETFAKELSKSCLVVWVDYISSFGTFPLEAMKCGVPTVGLIPQMVPEWMYDQEKLEFKPNGTWVTSKNEIPKQIGNFLDLWITNRLGDELYENMDVSSEDYDYVKFNFQTQNSFEKIFQDRKEFIAKLMIKQNETNE